MWPKARAPFSSTSRSRRKKPEARRTLDRTRRAGINDAMRRAPRLPLAATALAAAAVVIAVPGTARAQSCEYETHRIASVQAENDLFGSGEDRHYTHGSRASLVLGGGVPDFLRGLSAITPAFGEGNRMQVTAAIGQSIFTPDDISVSTLQRGDRPYAGWTYAAAGIVAFHQECGGDATRIDTLDLALGVVGPASQADTVQRTWHEWIGSPEPQGWQHQLDDEPGLVLTYERRLPRRVDIEWFEDRLPFDLEADATPHFGFSLGNIFTHANAGATVRIGTDLSTTDGVPRIRPSSPGSAYFEPSPDVDWQAFAGFDLRAVARNIFLDGNSFRKSHRVEKEIFVADFQVGASVTVGRVRVSFTNIFRSREFGGQAGWDEFGSLSAAFHF